MRTKYLTTLLVFAVSVLVISETTNVFGTALIGMIRLSGFQVHVGDQWVYENESKDGDFQRPEITRWISEVTVTDIVNIPQGQVVLVQARFQGPHENNGYIAKYSDGNYLVNGNCIYFLDVAWDAGALKP